MSIPIGMIGSISPHLPRRPTARRPPWRSSAVEANVPSAGGTGDGPGRRLTSRPPASGPTPTPSRRWTVEPLLRRGGRTVGDEHRHRPHVHRDPPVGRSDAVAVTGWATRSTSTSWPVSWRSPNSRSITWRDVRSASTGANRFVANSAIRSRREMNPASNTSAVRATAATPARARRSNAASSSSSAEDATSDPDARHSEHIGDTSAVRRRIRRARAPSSPPCSTGGAATTASADDRRTTTSTDDHDQPAHVSSSSCRRCGERPRQRGDRRAADPAEQPLATRRRRAVVATEVADADRDRTDQHAATDAHSAPHFNQPRISLSNADAGRRLGAGSGMIGGGAGGGGLRQRP